MLWDSRAILIPPSQAITSVVPTAPEERQELRPRQEIRCTFCCWPPGPLARRERRAYPVRPVRYVWSEQHRQRACGPQPGGARRLASARPALAPKCTPYFLTGPNRPNDDLRLTIKATYLSICQSSIVNRKSSLAGLPLALRFGEYSVVGRGKCVLRDLVPTDPCDLAGLARAGLSRENAAKEHVDLHGEAGIGMLENSGGGFGLNCEPGFFFHLARDARCGIFAFGAPPSGKLPEKRKGTAGIALGDQQFSLFFNDGDSDTRARFCHF